MFEIWSNLTVSVKICNDSERMILFGYVPLMGGYVW